VEKGANPKFPENNNHTWQQAWSVIANLEKQKWQSEHGTPKKKKNKLIQTKLDIT
jgi:hypothetical protein